LRALVEKRYAAALRLQFTSSAIGEEGKSGKTNLVRTLINNVNN
jgi:hypothetical protein